MYAGFNLTINNDNIFDTYESDKGELYSKCGRKLYEDLKKYSLENLKQIINKDLIDGDTLQNMWFPNEFSAYDNFIFVSHSHNDKNTAIKLAGYLKAKFNICSFIDSCVWGHIDELNKILNDCSKTSLGNCYGCNCDDFSYNLSYVHMMLTSALMTMIDKCECMFFLNTPSSININKKTESPWLYYELNVAGLIQKKRDIIEPVLEHGLAFKRNIEFTPNLKELIKITVHDLKNWEKQSFPGSPSISCLTCLLQDIFQSAKHSIA